MSKVMHSSGQHLTSARSPVKTGDSEMEGYKKIFWIKLWNK